MILDAFVMFENMLGNMQIKSFKAIKSSYTNLVISLFKYEYDIVIVSRPYSCYLGILRFKTLKLL